VCVCVCVVCRLYVCVSTRARVGLSVGQCLCAACLYVVCVVRGGSCVCARVHENVWVCVRVLCVSVSALVFVCCLSVCVYVASWLGGL
jgi:hypothetical protein